MEDSEISKSEITQKRPLSGAERQAIYRQKGRGSKTDEEGGLGSGLASFVSHTDLKYSAPPIQQGTLLRTGLGPAKILQAVNIPNQNQMKESPIVPHSLHIGADKMNLDNKIQRLANQQLPDLHQLFLSTGSDLERAELINQQVSENIFLFLEYMEAYQSPTLDFLSLVVRIGETLDDTSNTKLLVRVCKMHRYEELSISSGMVMKVMQFLCYTKHDNGAANGLLRLIFQNGISLAGFPVPLLVAYQTTYDRVIANYFMSLSNLNKAVIESLPSSTFCLTTPMLAALKTKGECLHQNIPYQFLPYVLEIIGHSFTDSSHSFHTFLETLRGGCRSHYENLLEFKFELLLEALSAETRQTGSIFFGSLEEQTNILTKAFELISEKRMVKFDVPSITMLIRGSQESYQAMKSRPRILAASKQSLINRCVEEFRTQNRESVSGLLPLGGSLTDNQLEVFLSLGVQNLLIQQRIAFNLCVHSNFVCQYFIQYETGQGKTALCFAIGTWKTLQGECALIVNNSHDLTFRDYKIATKACAQLNLRVLYAGSDGNLSLEKGTLYYITANDLINLLQTQRDGASKDVCLLVDEFDSIIFTHAQDNAQVVKYISQCRQVFAFTGSELQTYHLDYVAKVLHGININMNNISRSQGHVSCKDIQVHCLIPTFKGAVSLLCKTQTQFSPVILITDSHRERLQKTLTAAGIPVEDISEASPTQIESALSVFTSKQKSSYPVFFINPEQGRGIDFPSTSEIEAAGGNCVIAASLPASYLQYKQFLGRTGRICNKGQYAVILYDKDTKNSDGRVYLQKKLEELKNSEILQLAELARSEAATNDRVVSNLPEQEEEKQNGIKYQDDASVSSSIDPNSAQQEALPLCFQGHNSSAEAKGHSDSSFETQNNSSPEIAHTGTLTRKKKRDLKLMSKQSTPHKFRLRLRDALRSDVDTRYFHGYADASIHSEMLQDRVRMDTYRAAIAQLCNGKVVIDVGAGTGVLSIMAAQSGAEKVFAIEYTDIAKAAKEAVAQNDVTDKIVVFQERAEDVVLPIESADVILSEWMGYFLLFENMLPSVSMIRKQYLKPEGAIIPSSASLYLAAFRGSRNDHGINLNFLNKAMSCKAEVDLCQGDEVAFAAVKILELDLANDELHDNTFESRLSIRVTTDGEISGLVGWFDVQLAVGIELSTSPSSVPTHWKQTLFYFDRPIYCMADSRLEGSIQVTAAKENYRALDIRIILAAGEGWKRMNMNYCLE